MIGHHPEEYEGHRRYMGDNSRVMIGYSNMYGYRRNIPKLRHEPPSSFGFDPRWYERISKSYKRSYTEEELMEHYKHTYVIGYPFHDNNYNNFHARNLATLFISSYKLNWLFERRQVCDHCKSWK